MSLLTIPTLTDGATTVYDQRVRLDGTDYLFDFRWNQRRAVWVFSITGLDGARILTGQTIVCGVPLLGRAVGGPPGRLLALAVSPTDFEAPGLTELGGRVSLIYLTEDDPLLA